MSLRGENFIIIIKRILKIKKNQNKYLRFEYFSKNYTPIFVIEFYSIFICFIVLVITFKLLGSNITKFAPLSFTVLLYFIPSYPRLSI